MVVLQNLHTSAWFMNRSVRIYFLLCLDFFCNTYITLVTFSYMGIQGELS